MARMRTIKPEYWTSPQATRCSIPARLLFIGLWTFSDCAGRHPADVRRLKLEVLPADNLSDDDIDNLIQELHDEGLIFTYRVQNAEYWQTIKFVKHQSPKNPTRRYPDHSDGEIVRGNDEGIRTYGKNVGSVTTTLPQDSPSGTPHLMEDGRWKMEDEKIDPATPGSSLAFPLKLSLFLDRWRSIANAGHTPPAPGDLSVSTSAVRKRLDARLKDPDWPWEAALEKFPLRSGSTISLWTFLKPETAGRIVAGDFDWEPGVKNGGPPEKVKLQIKGEAAP